MPPPSEDPVEAAPEEETSNEPPTEAEEDKDNVSGGKQGRIRSTSHDDGDRVSYGSNKQGPLDSSVGTRKDRGSIAKSDSAPTTIPVVALPVFHPPWPEWSDDFINEETWDVDSGVDYYEDMFAATDFLNLKAYHWLRPSEFFREPPSVVKFCSPIIDLITPNAHLCEKSELLRYILSEISELYDYSIQNKFVECEGEGLVYVPNYGEDDRRWTPWCHIYSCCKAGIRGEKPVYNPKGKYYVRLYFLGAWRRILVDDRIPVLPSGHSGLPLTSQNELWPLLLTKALLKVATVTWKDDDVKKFSAISILTGWVFEWIDNIDGVNEDDLWADLQNTLPKYVDPKKIPSCYTLLHPSRKKQKFGNVEESDTFWWMPPVAVHISEVEDAALRDEAEDEPFELDTMDIVSEPIKPIIDETIEGEQILRPALEIRWTRKTVRQEPQKRSRQPGADSSLNVTKDAAAASSRNLLDPNYIPAGDKVEDNGITIEVGTDDKADNLPANDAMTVTKKKKKKAGIGAALEDSKSERKSVAPKKHAKKQKDAGDAGGKSKPDLKKRSRLVSTPNDLNDPQETTDAPNEDPEDDKMAVGKKSVKLKTQLGMKRWNQLKNILMGDSYAEMEHRLSKSLRRSYIEKYESSHANITKSKHKQKRGDRDLEDGLPLISTEDVDEASRKKKKSVLPSVPEILYGVQKYAGIDYRNIVKNWENICGKDSPITLMVVLKQFPTSEEDMINSTIPFVPGFLQHPIQLSEVRDTVLQRPSDRPETPLWKRFRWKKWAMKKGLIPLEEDHSRDIIRAVKAKTPFVFKTDWFDFSAEDLEYEEEEEVDEFGGEDDDDDFYGGTTFFFSLKPGRTKSKDLEPIAPPPPTPPPTKVPTPPQQARKNSAVPGTQTMARISKAESVRPPGPQPTLLLPPDGDTKVQNSRKSVMTAKSGGYGLHDSDNVKTSPPRVNGEKASSLGGGQEGGSGSNTMLVLHEAEIVQGESEEDFDEGFKRKMLRSQDNIQPVAACASLWFNCSDIASNLRKFCKFYTSQSIFGSCYILRREPSIPLVLNSLFYDLHSDLPKYPETLTAYKQKQDCLNLSIEFDRCKSYSVTDYHLDNAEGVDSAFYLYSDCWTEQELIISAHLLQDECLKKYKDLTASTLTEEMPGPPPTPMSRGIHFLPNTPPKPMNLCLTLVIEPWDWRQDTCIAQPLLLCTWINERWISHVNLPAGRNTFRVWLLYHDTTSADFDFDLGKRVMRDSDDETAGQNEFLRKKNSVPFSVRIVSQTPIYVGSRTEVLNYMTNPPMLLLKQCERLANNLWGLFACFGKQRSAYYQNLRQLRRSYCPAYSQPNMINKFNKGAHDTFEELFVSLVTQFNDGKLDRMLVLTLRVLFLNPMIGRLFNVRNSYKRGDDMRIFYGIFKGLGKKTRWMLTNATMVIQRYYRGWRVRRLFQLRRKSHPDFKKIEYNVRRIALLLARETDSVFAQKDPLTGEYGGGDNLETIGTVSVADMTVDPEKVPPTILPTPPHWAVDLLRFLMERHPWLITVHPHANCVSHQVKIQELTGELPQYVKDFSWYPFLREVLKVPPQGKSCFVELDLQVYPPLGIVMKIINNDNGKFLHTVTNRQFIGRLFENKYGYTILCYRWAVPTMEQKLNDRPPSNLWKLRLVTPQDQIGPWFQTRTEYLTDVVSGEEINENNNVDLEDQNRSSFADADGGEKRDSVASSKSDRMEFPNKLTLRRLTGYYTPNKDYSVCQYILETDEKRATISLRFLASNSNARLRVHVWDCNKKAVVFDDICESGLIAPTIQLHLSRQKSKKSESPEEMLSPGSNESIVGLHSPISEDLEGSHSGLPEMVMDGDAIINANNNESKASSKVSMGEEEEVEENENEEVSQRNSQELEITGSVELSKKESEKSTEMLAVPEKKATNKRRYIISVYVVDDTWPLTDRELLYVLYKERKFFRSIKAHHCKEIEKQQEEAKKKAEEEEQTSIVIPVPATPEGQLANNGPGRISAQVDPPVVVVPGGEGVPAGTTTLVTPTGEQTDGKKDAFQSVKRKTKKKDGEKSGAGPSTGPENNGNVTSSAPTTQPGDSTGTTAYPTTPPPSTISASNIDIVFGDDITKVTQKTAGAKKKAEGKIKRRVNGSLQVKYGGHQSQNVKHLDQPHWILEIVTDSKIKYKLKSNWQILRKRLLLAKESWESGGVELLYQDLSTRLDFLLESMVEDNYNKVKLHKFVMVDPMTNLYSCLHMDDYDLTGFANHDFIRLLVQAWSVDPEESKKAGEKFLQKRKKKLPIILNEQEQPPEPPKPEQILDYVPKNLRKLAETFYQRIEEREVERERLQRLSKVKPMNSSEEMDDDEEEEEAEAESPVVGGGSSGTGAGSEHPHSTHHHHPPNTGDGETGATATTHLGVPGNALRVPRKTNSDARTERSGVTKKGKKLLQPDLAAQSVKTGSRKPKIDKETRASIRQGKIAAQELEAAKSQRNSRAESEKRKSGGTAEKEEEPKEDSETELARIKSCSYVAEILKRYEAFFRESNSIRMALVEMIDSEQKPQMDGEEGQGPRKVLLAKTGISKYIEKEMSGEKVDEEQSEEDESVDKQNNMESLVGNKLLRWAYDYSCLPPTEEQEQKIEDPGELPLFIMRAIMADQREREKLEEELRAAAEALVADEDKLGEQDE